MITDIEKLKSQLIVIHNRKAFLTDIPMLHPDSPKYIQYWTEQTRRCIEGYWGFDNVGWRFMPPTLYFYGNFFKIYNFDKFSKVRIEIPPLVRDIDWIIHYSFLVVKGFSGFKDDEQFTCSKLRLTWDESKTPRKTNELAIYNSKGKLKTYIEPYEYLKQTFKKPLGKALYHNSAKNLLIFGSRGGGKSYSVAGITAHHLTFDGMTEFTQDLLDNPPRCLICIGSSETGKSGELCAKVADGLLAQGVSKSLGVWGDINSDDFTPNPFYRDWIGELKVGEKKKFFRYNYDTNINGRWVKDGGGTGSGIVHVNYSDKKQGGAQAAAGGRYAIVEYEEVGLMPNFIDALLSNVATVSGDGEQVGVQIGIGTSGNIDLVQDSKKVFFNPKDYNFLEFDDIWGNSGKIGLFIPAYIVDSDEKDENGNTNIEQALLKYMKRREEAKDANDPDVLRTEMMNYPLIPEDMFVSRKGSYFPVIEALERERQLIKDNEYRKIGTPSKLIWDSNMPNGVRAEYDDSIEPFYEFPYTRSISQLDGGLIIYEHPQKIKGVTPDDMYIATLDPYVAENIEDGESLGVFFIFLNPKYTRLGYNGNYLVASYIGKNRNGTDAFYEIIEKSLAYYGNPIRGLWYEANRGSSVRDYFIRKNKTNLLAIRPTRAIGKSAVEKRVLEFGYYVNNNIDKKQMITDTAEWLLSETQFNGKKCRVIENFPCIFTLRQMIAFDYKASENYDAISALIGYPLALKELEHYALKDEPNAIKHNPIAFLSVNPNIFKTGYENNRFNKQFK